jgi:hypothetical protein
VSLTPKQAAGELRPPPPPEEIDKYLCLGKEDIVKLVLCLLIEESLKSRLAAFRAEHFPPQPIQG